MVLGVMARKKSCYGCRALDIHVVRAYSVRGVCTLGYKIEMKNKDSSRDVLVPINKSCPKPRTYNELFRLLDEKEQKG